MDYSEKAADTEVVEKEKLKGKPMLVCFDRNGHVGDIPLSGLQILGRNSSEDSSRICMKYLTVSRVHGEFGVMGDKCFYRDLGSSNGTWVNGKLIRKSAEGDKLPVVTLKEGDILSVKPYKTPMAPPELVMVFTLGEPGDFNWGVADLTDAAEMMVGRWSSKIPLNGSTVSRRHASFFKASAGWTVIDLESTNGVWVNSVRITNPVYLKHMDIITIGRSIFWFGENSLAVGRRQEAEAVSQKKIQRESQKNISEGFCLKEGVHEIPSEFRPREESQSVQEVFQPKMRQVGQGTWKPAEMKEKRERERVSGAGEWQDHLTIAIEERNVWTRLKKKTLLKDIYLDIEQGDMVLVLGGSGAGKTTFMNAVMGYEKAKGQITYRDMDIYDEYEQMKYEIGFVPQQDLLRGSDTVFDTLYNSALMRMPSSATEEDCCERAEEVLELLGLEQETGTLVRKLSGGQRKRLSIAAEFVGNPKLFFLDEPDSGLDGVMARSLMENLRQIADEGKIVMVITHGPDRARDLFDKVIVLVKSARDNCGHLAFYGNIQQALEYFDTDSLEGVVRKVNRRDEGGEGLADYYIDRFAEIQSER